MRGRYATVGIDKKYNFTEYKVETYSIKRERKICEYCKYDQKKFFSFWKDFM